MILKRKLKFQGALWGNFGRAKMREIGTSDSLNSGARDGMIQSYGPLVSEKIVEIFNLKCEFIGTYYSLTL